MNMKLGLYALAMLVSMPVARGGVFDGPSLPGGDIHHEPSLLEGLMSDAKTLGAVASQPDVGSKEYAQHLIDIAKKKGVTELKLTIEKDALEREKLKNYCSRRFFFMNDRVYVDSGSISYPLVFNKQGDIIDIGGIEDEFTRIFAVLILNQEKRLLETCSGNKNLQDILAERDAQNGAGKSVQGVEKAQ